MDIAIQAGWFIGTVIALAYSFKWLGGARMMLLSFLLSFLLGLWMVFMTLMSAFREYPNMLAIRALLIPTFFWLLTFIYAMACWTVWRRKPSARVWAIVASLTYILVGFPISAGVHPSPPIRGCSIVMLGMGIIGLVIFSRRVIKYDLPPADQANA